MCFHRQQEVRSTIHRELLFKLKLKMMQIDIRNLKIDDYNELREAMKKAYPAMSENIWSKKSIEKLIKIFPDGQICITVNDKIAAVCLSLIVQYELFGDDHTYAEITGNYTFNTHSETGNVLYGIEIFVDPEYRELRLARRLYDARKELCEKLNLKSIIVGGRIPNYLPGVNNMDIQYGQAAVFTPSDFPFPSNAIKGEATPNTETTLIVDVDLNLLKELHHYGAVRTISDRRTDLYDVVSYQEGE